MSPVTHFLAGWVVANLTRLDRRGRALVTLASVAPDLDGLGILPELMTRNSAHPLLWFSEYHHRLHTLLFAALIAGVVFLLGRRSAKVAILAFVSFHLHLLFDLVGSRGPEGFSWPIPYLAPFTSRGEWAWHGQWALNAWPNLLLTIALLIATLILASRRGYSPVEIFSREADQPVIDTLRRWHL